jgi:micrococcal nuclease
MSLNNYDIRVISRHKMRHRFSIPLCAFHRSVVFTVLVVILTVIMLLAATGCQRIRQFTDAPNASISPLTAPAKPRAKEAPFQLDADAPISHEEAVRFAMHLAEPLENYDLFRPGGSANISSMQQVSVLRVVDGDTLMIISNGESFRLRLIGIDAPESYAHHDEALRTHLGESISRIVMAWLTGKTIYLEYDVECEDPYGRRLAYAWLDEHYMINEILAREGFVDVKCYKPNVRYNEYFKLLKHLAKEEGRGIWAKTEPQNNGTE